MDTHTHTHTSVGVRSNRICTMTENKKSRRVELREEEGKKKSVCLIFARIFNLYLCLRNIRVYAVMILVRWLIHLPAAPLFIIKNDERKRVVCETMMDRRL